MPFWDHHTDRCRWIKYLIKPEGKESRRRRHVTPWLGSGAVLRQSASSATYGCCCVQPTRDRCTLMYVGGPGGRTEILGASALRGRKFKLWGCLGGSIPGCRKYQGRVISVWYGYSGWSWYFSLCWEILIWLCGPPTSTIYDYLIFALYIVSPVSFIYSEYCRSIHTDDAGSGTLRLGRMPAPAKDPNPGHLHHVHHDTLQSSPGPSRFRFSRHCSLFLTPCPGTWRRKNHPREVFTIARTC